MRALQHCLGLPPAVRRAPDGLWVRGEVKCEHRKAVVGGGEADLAERHLSFPQVRIYSTTHTFMNTERADYLLRRREELITETKAVRIELQQIFGSDWKYIRPRTVYFRQRAKVRERQKRLESITALELDIETMTKRLTDDGVRFDPAPARPVFEMPPLGIPEYKTATFKARSKHSTALYRWIKAEHERLTKLLIKASSPESVVEPVPVSEDMVAWLEELVD